MIKLVIFDFDGVIFNTEDSVFKLIKKLCRKYKCDVKTKDDFLELYNENFYSSIAKKGVKGNKLDKFKKECEEELKHIHMKLFQTVPPILSKLSHRYYLAIISSNFKNILMQNLRKHKLLGYFSLLVGADYEESKIERIEYCLKKFNIKPIEAIYIGDTAGDIIEAKKAKVKTMAVTWGFHKCAKLKKEKPTYIASRPSQILKILDLK